LTSALFLKTEKGYENIRFHGRSVCASLDDYAALRYRPAAPLEDPEKVVPSLDVR
jgi:hypothetical protein